MSKDESGAIDFKPTPLMSRTPPAERKSLEDAIRSLESMTRVEPEARPAEEVVHFEIPAQDVERARRFYHETFGWSASLGDLRHPSIPALGRSRTLLVPEKPDEVNVQVVMGEAVDDRPLITIQVGDIDKASPTITLHGGTVVQRKHRMGTLGFEAYVRDTEGNLIGLFQPSR